MNFFDIDNKVRPLADRIRPQSLEGFFGQEHLVAKGKILHEAIAVDKLFSMILWGPPGSGKTTLAQIIANSTKANFIQISSVTASVADLKKIISLAATRQKAYGQRTILYIDEIHRFNKAQQDVFLPHVEKGVITLIGATTENPSFEVIGPLLSRSRVLVLEPLAGEHIRKIVNCALVDKERGLGDKHLKIAKDALEMLIHLAAGDARFALNTLEIAADLAREGATLGIADIERAAVKRSAIYYKKGEAHYDTISAFIKSMRAGKADAVMHYLARMIEAGEDPVFIARRMVIFAAEDIGNAQPTAFVLATSCMQAVHMVGMPESALILAQTAAYLAQAPKSIAATSAISAALSDVRKMPLEAIPLHLRNPVTKLMKDLGYGKGHVRYPWMEENKGEETLEYMPKNLVGRKYYQSPKKK